MAECVFDSTLPFSASTCRSLATLLIRIAALPPDEQPPASLVNALESLAEQDGNWRAWCCAALRNTSELGGASHVPAEVGADPQTPEVEVAWPLLPLRLAQLLVTSFGESIGQAAGDLLAGDFAMQSPPTPWQQLLAIAHLVVRQQALTANLAAELQRQKTEAIYQFAYGLSHELNNPLANIATRAGLLAAQETRPHSKSMLEAIVVHALRGSEMLGDLMLVARPPKLRLSPTRVDQLILTVVEKARPWAADCQVEITLALESTRWAEVDSSAMHEAIWALVRNALEAMPDGGELSLSVSDEGRAIVIAIADQGQGLSRQAVEHGFDPYFSGREAGRGLGLGLSKAKRIVDLHGGRIRLYNRCHGCVAEIRLPNVQPPAGIDAL